MRGRAILAVVVASVASTPVRADFRLSPADGASHSYPGVCRRPDGFVAVWERDDADGRDVVIQRLDQGGHPLGAASYANQQRAGDQQLPDVACAGDGSFVVAWESRGQDGDGLGIFARAFGADGTPRGDERQINEQTSDDQRRPRLCIGPAGSAVVVWESTADAAAGPAIYARRLSADGTPDGGELLISDAGAGGQSEPAIACAADGRSLIAWTSRRDDGSEVVARLLGADGTVDARLFRVSEEGAGPARRAAVAARPDGSFQIALETPDADLNLTTLSLPAGGGSSLTVRALRFAGRDEAPAIAVNDRGDILIAWSQGSGFDFDIAGLRTTLGAETERMTALNANRPGNDGALGPLGRGIAVADAADGDLVLWQKRDVTADDSSAAIFARRFADCIGDCSRDRFVGINELIQGVRIALNQTPLDACPTLDGDGNGAVAINELIRAVREALAGICPAPLD